MATYENVFAGILTPEVVQAERQAKSDKQWGAFNDPWVSMAANYGLELRKALNDKGIALSPEDEKAYRNEAILKEASQSVRDDLESGKLAPGDADKELLNRSMGAFVQAGDYEAAAGVAAQLREIGKAEAEIQKLYAARYSSLMSGDKDSIDATRILGRTEPEIDLLEAQAQKERALAGKADREPAAKGKGDGGLGNLTPSEAGKIMQVARGSLGAQRGMLKIGQLLHANPGIGSEAGKAISKWRSELHGAMNYLGTKEKAEDYEKAVLPNIEKYGTFRQQAKALKARGIVINAEEYKAVTMDLAYALAKARDPGGRLSDADVANAMSILGQTGNPAAQMAILARLQEETYTNMQNYRLDPLVGKSERFADTFDMLDEQKEEWDNFLKEITTEQKEQRSGLISRQPGGSPPTPTAATIEAGETVTTSSGVTITRIN